MSMFLCVWIYWCKRKGGNRRRGGRRMKLGDKDGFGQLDCWRVGFRVYLMLPFRWRTMEWMSLLMWKVMLKQYMDGHSIRKRISSIRGRRRRQNLQVDITFMVTDARPAM